MSGTLQRIDSMAEADEAAGNVPAQSISQKPYIKEVWRGQTVTAQEQARQG